MPFHQTHDGATRHEKVTNAFDPLHLAIETEAGLNEMRDRSEPVRTHMPAERNEEFVQPNSTQLEKAEASLAQYFRQDDFDRLEKALTQISIGVVTGNEKVPVAVMTVDLAIRIAIQLDDSMYQDRSKRQSLSAQNALSSRDLARDHNGAILNPQMRMRQMIYDILCDASLNYSETKPNEHYKMLAEYSGVSLSQRYAIDKRHFSRLIAVANKADPYLLPAHNSVLMELVKRAIAEKASMKSASDVSPILAFAVRMDILAAVICRKSLPTVRNDLLEENNSVAPENLRDSTLLTADTFSVRNFIRDKQDILTEDAEKFKQMTAMHWQALDEEKTLSAATMQRAGAQYEIDFRFTAR